MSALVTPLRIVNRTPRVYVADDFATDAEVRELCRAGDDVAALERAGIACTRDETGLAFELPLDRIRTAAEVSERMHAVLGLDNALGGTLRWRRYTSGEFHPPHNDSFAADGRVLIATALLFLTDVRAGGETQFPEALPDVLRVRPRAGRLLAWFSHAPDGSEDPLALHEGLPVIDGEKTTVTEFFYCDLADAGREPHAEPWFEAGR